jgi:hypothetical protein
MTPQLARLVHRLLREETKARRTWQPILASAFRTYGKRVADAFADALERRSKANPWKLPLKADEWDAAAQEAISFSWGVRDVQLLADSYGRQFLSIAKMTFESIESELGLGVMLTDPMQQSILKTAGRRLGLLDLEQETKDNLFKALAQGREEGLGVDALSNLIEDLVSKGPWSTPEIRAKVIARTETKYAQNYSSLEAYRASDTVTDALIFDAQLGDTDAECEALNGETVSLEEAMYLMEAEHPNGTRSFAPVVGEAEKAGRTIVLKLPEAKKRDRRIVVKRDAAGALVGTIEEVVDATLQG